MSLRKLDNFEQQLDKIRRFLPDYLADHKLDVRGGRKIVCINPEHEDRNPSMSMFETDEGSPVVHCFSCSCTVDIFQAAHILEHKPIVGPGFIRDNVSYLAEKYDIELEYKQLSEEEIYEHNTYDAYRMVADYISAAPLTDEGKAELERRGWTEEFARSNQVGMCDDFGKMRTLLKMAGYSVKFLEEIDLDNKYIFSPTNLIFTICDDYGRPVGFAARNLKFDGVRDDNGRLVNGPKYNNTKTTGVKCNIYRKSERLYLLHKAKTKSPPLYIFEGYGDALTLHTHGLENSVAIGSLELSEHHLNTCRRNGIYDVVICLDPDEKGQEKAKKLLDEALKHVHDIKIRFIFLPSSEDGTKLDPDEYVRRHGLAEFVKLPKVDPFEWRLMEFLKDETADSEAICFSMIPIILNEPSPIKRERMIRDLSDHTGYSEKVIKDELDKLVNSEEAKIQARRQAVIDSITSSLEKRSDSFEILLQRGIDELYTIDKEKNSGNLTPDTMVNNILGIKEYEENEHLHTAVEMGETFRSFSVALSGDLRQKMVVLGGGANTGKTTKFANLAWNLAELNDDVIAITLTIDDSAKEFVPRLITYDIARRTYRENRDLFNMVTINKVATPFLYKEELEYDAIMSEREKSFKRLLALTRDERLIVLDSENGKSIDYINHVIKWYSERHPSKRIVMFIDNFHLVDVPGMEEGRGKYKTLSRDLKQICVTYDATIITTAEYTKIQKGMKPSNNNLAETVALEYDANAIIHLYSELHDLREQSNKFFEIPFGTQPYPVVEAYFGKNKISAFKGNIWYRFYPDKAYYHEITNQEMMDLEQANKADKSARLEEMRQNAEANEDRPLNRFD